RLSVTDRCNFRCRYCLPPGFPRAVKSAPPLPPRELVRLVRTLCGQYPITRVKLTGGEPLVRREIVEIVSKLSSIEGIEEISMTTNGALLASRAAALKRAGLRRVNVSLDSLDPDRFAALTHGGRLDRTLAGIEAALDAGLKPVKLNSVLLRSTWEREVPALLEYSAARGLEVRFIELMRTGTDAEWVEGEFISADLVRRWLERHGEVAALPELPEGPARRTRLRWAGREITVGWITPLSHPFCGDCSRLRMDARGTLRRCLMDDAVFPFADRADRLGEKETRNDLDRYLAGKRPPATMGSEATMNAVGG
ncbi:MAG TPA: GTP 3',8-cyclase MoaA, partial [Bacteroidetes bacterium]|nr:GTP 3',8-cyclase MoaA [Bacteroidota bacterium]